MQIYVLILFKINSWKFPHPRGTWAPYFSYAELSSFLQAWLFLPCCDAWSVCDACCLYVVIFSPPFAICGSLAEWVHWILPVLRAFLPWDGESAGKNHNRSASHNYLPNWQLDSGWGGVETIVGSCYDCAGPFGAWPHLISMVSGSVFFSPCYSCFIRMSEVKHHISTVSIVLLLLGII